MDTSCVVCEEVCPVSPKAIFTRNVEVTDRWGATLELKRPYIDPVKCIGCGICEHECPVKDDPAVYVTAIGETRDKSRSLLLSLVEARARTGLGLSSSVMSSGESMQLAELLDLLPNGLHDAEIDRISIDYISRIVMCEIEIWLGGMDSLAAGRESYRRASLTFDAMEYCAMERPDPLPGYDYDSGKPLWIDACEPGDLRAPYNTPRTSDAFVCRLFVRNWNAFITICGSLDRLLLDGRALLPPCGLNPGPKPQPASSGSRLTGRSIPPLRSMRRTGLR